MSPSPRRHGDPAGADHSGERTTDPVLAERVAGVAVDVAELSAEVRALRTDLGGLASSLARWEGVREGETTGVRQSPVGNAKYPADVLAEWIASWSPWQVVVLVALAAGGPTVAGPAVERLISTLAPARPTEVEITHPDRHDDHDEDADDAAGVQETGLPGVSEAVAPRPTL